MIPPGSTLGLLGGGQLGRMFAIAARRMGYRVHTYEPSPESPAGQISDREFNAPYTDLGQLEAFARSVDVITFEFENIPSEALQHVARITPLYPDWKVLHICQNRRREKEFLRANGYPHAPFALVRDPESLRTALQSIGTPGVLKTADFGYDGKGQLKLGADTDPVAAWKKFEGAEAVYEGWIEHQMELSVIAARTREGRVATFPVAENRHRNHILDISIIPARVPEKVLREAEEIASAIADGLQVVGLITCELFWDKSGKLLVNELAPRPHNSGHYSFDACVTSQFEQQLRAVCGLPLGSTRLLSPVVMVNLLGDVWKDGPPHWDAVLQEPGAKLHLYGKTDPRPGRKMGHFCVMSETAEAALHKAEELKTLLKIPQA
jgi:5-(carboxyamino)imidazole ribonucleotide synthase